MTYIREIADRFGSSWLVYTAHPTHGWSLYVSCSSQQAARNAAARARRELRRIEG
jgi:hypothetical protein